MKETEMSAGFREALLTEKREGTGGRPGDLSDRTVVTLSGDLSVQRASELKDALQAAVKQGTHVVVEFAECFGADLSFVQLLCSAHRSAARLGKSLKLGASASAQFFMTVNDAGYSRDACCAFSSDRTCLWSGRRHA